MRKTEVLATFTGRDGSCGFKNGKEYNLVIEQGITKSGTNNEYSQRTAIFVQNKEKPDFEKTGILYESVEYDTIISFLNNWNNIRAVK